MAATEKGLEEGKIQDEALKLYLEEEDSLADVIDTLITGSFEDFPEADASDPAAQHAAEIARANITDANWYDLLHSRIIKAYIAYHLRRNPKWSPKDVNSKTPNHDKGFEGRKYATAISTRTALTFWYRTIRPNESVSEWRYDSSSNICYGLPTRSRRVSEFMMGLEKTKARAGEISNSARALSLKDMHNLHDQCFRPGASPGDTRWGIAAYLFAWLLLLRIEEVVRLEIGSIDIVPGERECFEVRLKTRKSAQTGITHVWVLHANDSDPMICPMRALIRLGMLYGENAPLSGSLFLRVNKYGAVLQDAPVTSTILSRALTTDLQDLGYKSWALFGTHSFRRGGCQHRIKDNYWTVDMVAAWGGWSQVEAITMFRYFYSPNDNHEHMAEYDRNRPKRQRMQYS
ncbi:hypothetical protein D9615_003799 [Tricholomella constricta]|uniref:Tyr recombinase domain-containing protein n=1 Tax=Tricholomella constricta TaxID=117010 RepID=A0A8H5HHY8_9AGAR|nr:hypothetical protein D9615_003799 [Tricholomella constricta]